MLIQTVTGKEDFETGSCKLHAFFAPTTRFPGKEVFLGQAAMEAIASIRRHGQRTVVPAIPGAQKIVGEWTTATYDIPERVVIKLFASKKLQNVSRPTMASVFIQMRETAPLTRCVFRTIGGPRAQYQQVSIEGRFDVIPATEAKALGVFIPAQYDHYSQQEYIDRLFSFVEVSPALRPRQEVAPRIIENSLGQEVEIAITRRRRGLSL